MKRERVDEQKRNGEKWRVAIEEYAVRPASSFQGNPRNWRKHPEAQRNAVAGSLRELGFIAPVIENRRTGHLIDGHERVWQALQHGDDTPVPVVVVDLPENQEHLALTVFDPITGMAEADRDVLASLMDDVRTGDAALQAMMEQLAEDEGLINAEVISWDDALSGLPEGDKDGFRQLTFILTDEQHARVQDAISKAKQSGPFENTGNENSNGNAITRIAESYCVG